MGLRRRTGKSSRVRGGLFFQRVVWCSCGDVSASRNSERKNIIEVECGCFFEEGETLHTTSERIERNSEP